MLAPVTTQCALDYGRIANIICAHEPPLVEALVRRTPFARAD